MAAVASQHDHHSNAPPAGFGAYHDYSATTIVLALNSSSFHSTGESNRFIPSSLRKTVESWASPHQEPGDGQDSGAKNASVRTSILWRARASGALVGSSKAVW